MAKLSDYLKPGTRFKASDIGESKLNLTVKSWECEEFEDRGGTVEKLVLGFEDDTRTLVLNASNLRYLSSEFGDDPDNLVGERLQLFTVQTTNPSGQPVLGIRVARAE